MGCNVKFFVPHHPPPVPRPENVLVYQYPHEFPSDAVAKELGMYGDVRDVSFQCWTYMPDVGTSTRLVRMVIQKQIPRIITILGIRCKLLYCGQPLTCDICSKNGYKASACPDKGKCLRCHHSGHFARQCPTPWPSAAAGTDSATGIDVDATADGGGAGGVDVVPPVVVDPSLVVSTGDLSRGL